MRSAVLWLLATAGLPVASPLHDGPSDSCQEVLGPQSTELDWAWLEESDEEAAEQNVQLLQVDLSLRLQRPIRSAGNATASDATSRLTEVVLQPWKAGLDQKALQAEGAAVASLLATAAAGLAEGDTPSERWPVLDTQTLGQYTETVRAPDMKWAVASLGFLLFFGVGAVVLGVCCFCRAGQKDVQTSSFTLKVAATAFIVALFLGAAWLAAWYFAGAVLKYWLERMDTSWLGVEVTSDKMSLNPWVGRLLVANLTLGNPKGYQSDHMLTAQSLLLDISMRELVMSLGHRLSIQQLEISDVAVTYEQALTTSNVRDFLGRFDPKLGPHPSGNGGGSPPWQVEVRLHEVLITNIWAKATLSITGNSGISLLVPNISWSDFDEEAKARGGAEIVSIILGSILNSVTRAVGQAVGR